MQLKSNRMSLLCVVVVVLFSASISAQSSMETEASTSDNIRAQETGHATTVQNSTRTQSSASVDNATAGPGTTTGFSMGEPAMKFPHWPNKRVFVHQLIPPPPLGPYMSTALSLGSMAEPEINPMKSIPAQTVKGSPVAGFDSNVPWPADEGEVKRWRPDNGYHFVSPEFAPVIPETMPAKPLNYQQPAYLPPARSTMNSAIRPSRRQFNYNTPGFVPGKMPFRHTIRSRNNATSSGHVPPPGRLPYESRYRLYSPSMRHMNNQAASTHNGYTQPPSR